MSSREISNLERKGSLSSSHDGMPVPIPPALPRPPSAPRSARPPMRAARSGASTPDVDSDDSSTRYANDDVCSLQAQIEQLKLKLAEERRCRVLAEKLLSAATVNRVHDCTNATQHARTIDECESFTQRSHAISPTEEFSGDAHPPTNSRLGSCTSFLFFYFLCTDGGRSEQALRRQLDTLARENEALRRRAARSVPRGQLTNMSAALVCGAGVAVVERIMPMPRKPLLLHSRRRSAPANASMSGPPQERQRSGAAAGRAREPARGPGDHPLHSPPPPPPPPPPSPRPTHAGGHAAASRRSPAPTRPYPWARQLGSETRSLTRIGDSHQ